MAKAVPYKVREDPNHWFRKTIEDKRGRGTHHTYDFLTCKVCGANYRPGLYKAHKTKPEHTAKMTGHRPVPVSRRKLTTKGRRAS